MSDKSNVSTLLESLEQTPCSDVLTQELENCITKFGSYVSIVKNKQLNQVAMVVEIIECSSLQKEFCNYFSCDSFEVALGLIFAYNPHLAKSKAIRDCIKHWKNNVRHKVSTKRI